MFFKIFKPKKSRASIVKPDISEYTGELFARQPRVKLLSNGITASYLCDSGASFMLCENGELTQQPYDLLEEALGVFCYVCFDNKQYCLSYAPKYSEDCEYEAAFSKSGVSYFAKTPELKLTTQVRLHSAFGGETRAYFFENRSEKDIEADAFIVLSPFSGEGTEVVWDEESNALLAISTDQKSYLAIGFYENKAFSVRAKEGEGEDEILPEIKKGELALCFSIKLLKDETVSLHLIIAYGKTKKLAVEALRQQRRGKPLDNQALKNTLLVGASLEAKRLIKLILPRILFSKRDSTAHLDYAFANTKRLCDLGRIDGISKDIPLIVVDIYSLGDKERIKAYLSSYLALKRCFLKVCFVFLYDGDDEIGKKLRKMIKEILLETDQVIQSDEVKILSSRRLSRDEQNLLHAAACHIATRSLVRIEMPVKSFSPLLLKEKGMKNEPDKLSIIALSEQKQIAVIKQNEEKSFDGAMISYSITHQAEKGRIIEAFLTNTTQEIKKLKLGCYNKLLFGADRLKGQLIKGEYIKEEGILALFNPMKDVDHCWLAISSMDKSAEFCCDRADFLSGEWESEILPPCYDPCMAAYFSVILKANEKKKLTLYFGYGQKKEMAISELCILKGLWQGIDKKL